ncbi:MAG TPA: aldose epimerase family protein [Verrucomicrobiota bacterium]|nr:aldose epimerase family protein [Verrucomicrobiota bacterium]HQB16660.1 aldose epimerase family protein [Verrucomicrobiota bacterium]
MQANVIRTHFGQLADGTPVDLFTLTNAAGLIAKITNYGTIITELHVPDRAGRLGDVVLGFDQLAPYLAGHPYFGCTTGRVCNRIAHGRFTLAGQIYTLALNNQTNHLHGGVRGLDKVVWQAEPQPGAAVRFCHCSPDGDEGYPGQLDLTVLMTLTDAQELVIDYTATTDRPTPVNLTNHSYFNLAGAGDVLGHELQVWADFYTPSDAELIPTGEIRSVAGTPLDFRQPRLIGARWAELTTTPRGYDNNFVLRGASESPALAARVFEPGSGRVLEVLTTEPGLQFYTGNFLDGSLTGKGGVRYGPHSGFCLETQHFADAVNQPHFPSIILRPGQTYRHTTIHRFSTR